jgi:hypothetical protein
MGAYVSTCQEWTRSSLFTVRCISAISVLPHRPDDLCFSEEDSDLVCQPGVGWMEINETLKEKGIPLFFPVRIKCRTRDTLLSLLHPQLDPGPTATVGGMLSTGCSGSQCSVIVNVLSPLLTTPDSQCRPLWHSEGRMVLECGQNTSFLVCQSPVGGTLIFGRQLSFPPGR